jgi:hypothetical protein
LRELTLGINSSDVALCDLTHLSDLVLRYGATDYVMMGDIEQFVAANRSNDAYRQVKWKQAPKHYLEWHRY